jgi:hypothetical protein
MGIFMYASLNDVDESVFNVWLLFERVTPVELETNYTFVENYELTFII